MKVSIVVPIYNTSLYIEKCVKSLFEQTHDDIEYIFIDDASTDDSLAKLHDILRSYPQLQDQVKIMRNEHNSGVALTRSIGMKEATGDYIIHVDSDDWVALDYVELLLNAAVSQELDVVMCDFFYCYKDRQVISATEKVESIDECVNKVLSGKCHGSLWNKLIKTSIIKKYSIYPEPQLHIVEDKLVVLSVLSHVKKIGYVNRPLYYYNKVNAGVSAYKAKAQLIPSFTLATKLLIDRYGSEPNSSLIYEGLQFHKAIVLGHILLYSLDLSKENIELFHDLPIKYIIKQPVSPVYYKLIGVFYKLRLTFLMSMMRGILRFIKK